MDDDTITIPRSEYDALNARIKQLEDWVFSLQEVVGPLYDSLRSLRDNMTFDLERIDADWERYKLDEIRIE